MHVAPHLQETFLESFFGNWVGLGVGSVSSPLCPKLTWEDFKTDKEAVEWVEGKAQECEDPNKPKKLRANYKTNEYWMVRDGGTDFETTSKVSEEMSRDGGDLSAGLAIVGGGPIRQPQQQEEHEVVCSRAPQVLDGEGDCTQQQTLQEHWPGGGVVAKLEEDSECG